MLDEKTLITGSNLGTPSWKLGNYSLASVNIVSIYVQYLSNDTDSTTIGMYAWFAPHISEHCP